MQDTSLTNQSPDRPYHSFLEGCRDTHAGSLSLFPECIRGELHGVRSVIEAFSKTGKLEACEGQVAAGLSVHEPIHIRAAGTQYTIRGLE